MKIGRNASSGRFTTVAKAIRSPSTHVVETVNPDKGGSGKPTKK